TEYGRDDILLRRDLFDRRGALTGLYTALSVATKPFVAVVACDMIFASARVLEAELEYLKETGCDAAVPSLTHGYEPFHAVYRRETCLEYVKAALDRGECRATSWFKDAKLFLLDSEAVLAADPRGGCFVNVNTPEELAEMERRLRNDEILLASDE
ncbi:MAG: NTP transferase domain-containing protein, partial [Actinobacteria bacterium]|nr:NTP transferase domain-containing protein [Actinomycetota bacterium]